MPYITLYSPTGFCFQIATRRTETTLRAWFDEILPVLPVAGRPGIDDFEILWPHISIRPMWALRTGPPSDPDWPCDSRVLGRIINFPARDGKSGLRELLRIRQELEQELKGLAA